ncbi:MAG: response regulator, partial [Spirochaetales bacterium]|nr:response regulator [Spirochaetales bacterium]
AILVIAFISILILVITSLIITLKQRKKNLKHIETAMKELQESRKLLSNVLNTIPVRVFWKDKDLVYLGCNTSFAEDAGFSSPEDIIGKDDYAFVWADTFADDFRKDDGYVIESGSAKLNFEEKIITANGETHQLLTSKVPLRNTQGDVIGMLGTYEDISEQKKIEKQKEQLQEQLIQAQKLESIGRLAGGIAHDFNNMLGVIIGHAGLLLQMTESLKDENVRNSLKEIEFAANRSANLTKQLMAYARKQPIHPELVDMNEEIAGLHNMLQRLIGEQIVFHWQPFQQALPIKIDPSQFDQILVNLTVNARKAINGNGTISISTNMMEMDDIDIKNISRTDLDEYPYSSKSLAVLSIQDSGAGMDEHTKEHLFEPFYTTREVGEGTGLGMSMVYGAVKQNNGLIHIDSEVGRGTTITIFFPIETADGDQDDTAKTSIHTYLDTGLTDIGNVQSDESGSSHEVSLHRKYPPMPKGTETVLFAEDESSFQQLDTSLLEQLGYTVLPAQNPELALELAAEQTGPIHLLITDVVMPFMDGTELAGKLSVLHPDMQVLYISGYTENTIIDHGITEGDIHFLQKPFSNQALAEKIRFILDNYK